MAFSQPRVHIGPPIEGWSPGAGYLGHARTGVRYGTSVSTRPVQLLQGLAGNVRPLSLARERVLPVLPALAGLVPGGLRRGTTVVVTTSTVTTSTVTTSTRPDGAGMPQGATSLALSLAAAASLTGSWCAVVGVPDLGLTAAAELGLVLSRVALVPSPPPAQWVTVVSALLDAVDLVIARPPAHLRTGDARRLSTRARERESVLVPLLTLPSHQGRGRPWSDGADIRLAVTAGRWEGPGAGDGRLVGRRLEVTGGGRGAAAQTRQTILWLPAPIGSGDGLAYAGADADQIPDATSQPAGAETRLSSAG
jgi:hypothetical protein